MKGKSYIYRLEPRHWEERGGNRWRDAKQRQEEGVWSTAVTSKPRRHIPFSKPKKNFFKGRNLISS